MSQLKKNILLALMGTIAFILMLTVSLPILPSASFLKYEPSGVVVLLSGVLFGPTGALTTCFVKDFLFFLVGAGNILGVFSDFVNTTVFAVTACLIIRKGRATYRRFIGYILAIILSTLVMIPVNLIILPLEFGITTQAVMEMMIPALLPFNLLKAVCNCLGYGLIDYPAVKAFHSQLR